MTTPVTPQNPLSVSLQGLKKAETRVSEAATRVQEAFTPPVTDAPQEAEPPAGDDTAAAAAVAAAEPAAALVDMLAAKMAYQASLAAVKVTGDIELETVQKLGRR